MFQFSLQSDRLLLWKDKRIANKYHDHFFQVFQLLNHFSHRCMLETGCDVSPDLISLFKHKNDSVPQLEFRSKTVHEASASKHFYKLDLLWKCLHISSCGRSSLDEKESFRLQDSGVQNPKRSASPGAPHKAAAAAVWTSQPRRRPLTAQRGSERPLGWLGTNASVIRATNASLRSLSRKSCCLGAFLASVLSTLLDLQDSLSKVLIQCTEFTYSFILRESVK